MFCVLSFTKDYRAMEENRRARRWQRYNVAEARGQTIGIVGLGGTGRVVAQHGERRLACGSLPQSATLPRALRITSSTQSCRWSYGMSCLDNPISSSTLCR